MKIKRLIYDDSGTEFVQFLFVMPLLLIVTMLCWQIFLIGQTISVGVHVTRVAARQYSMCEATRVDAEKWANAVAPAGFQPSDVRSYMQGDEATVEADFPIPTIHIPYILKSKLPDITLYATMRAEECRRGDRWIP